MPAVAWERTFNSGGDRTDYDPIMAVDRQGNTIVAGKTLRPSGSSSPQSGITIVKYGPTGNQLWVRSYAGTGYYDNWPADVKTDADGNIYVVGTEDGGVVDYNYVTIKYAPDGTRLWLKTYKGYRWDIATAMELDSAGNVLVTGYSESKYPDESFVVIETATVKYDPDGNELWVRRYSTARALDNPSDITVDADGNSYITGLCTTSRGGSNIQDVCTLKYSPAGELLWKAQFNGHYALPKHDYGVVIKTDGKGSVYVGGNTYTETATSFDYLLLKYDATTGKLLWNRTWVGPDNDQIKDLAVDGAGNAYLTGATQDPYGSTPTGQPTYDAATVKFDPAGNLLWARTYRARAHFAPATARRVILDAEGNAYVAAFSGEGDNVDTAVIKYLPDGTEAWVFRYDNPIHTNDTVGDMEIDGAGNLYVTGYASIPNDNGDKTTDFVTFQLSQSPSSPTPCSFSISPTDQIFTAGGGAGSVSVMTGPGCDWVAESNDGFITINVGNGRGNGTVNYSVAASTIPVRTGTITVAGLTFTVTQDSGCAISLSPTKQNFSADGGSGIVEVTTGGGCTWSAASNAPWINITSSGSESSGAVFYSVAVNSGQARTGTLTIGGQTFTVTQDSGCTYSINPTARNFDSSGGNGSVNVTSSAGCAWTAQNNSPSFITITSGASGAGNGTVGFSVAANSNTSQRTGTLIVAGQTFSVTQEGSAPVASYAISGQVSLNGVGLGGITVTLSGTLSASATTGADGRYSFANLTAGNNYTVTPANIGYIFEPLSRAVNNLSGDITVDFVASAAVSQSVIQFANTAPSVSEGAGIAVVTVTRSGDASGAASVRYSTTPDAALLPCDEMTGRASERCDYSTTVGELRFARGETTKTFTISITNDAFMEGAETIHVKLANPVGAKLGTAGEATLTVTDDDTTAPKPETNPILTQSFFVRQQYLDFLGREPDRVGYQGWQDILNNCGVTFAQPCDRIEVSAGFFRSSEFQERGYFTYRFYSVAFGRKPDYAEFMPDLAKVSGFLSDAEKEANKVAFVDEFMQRQAFKDRYDSTQGDATAYVDALLNTAGLPNHPSRAGWIAGLRNNTLTRPKVLRELVESAESYTKFYNEAFVVMQYFGYLRRDPDNLYREWIRIMNQDSANYRGLISGFVNSLEYHQRFGK
jgi:hypothetical protein